jgi:catechol 2,3-dioxygenase-like lactoylglutathione lyase family enzyme
LSSDSPEPILSGLERLVLRVASLPAATRYYGETLGLEQARAGPTFALFRLPDGRDLLLHNDPDLPEEAIYLRVDDVRDLYDRRDALRLRFMAAPTRIANGWRATVKDPFGTVLLLMDRDGDRSEPAAGGELGASSTALFPGVAQKITPRRELLIDLYTKAGRTADDLPYTPQFETIYDAYRTAYPEPQPDRAETWRHLLLLRKKGALPRLGAAKAAPPNDERATKLVLDLIDELFDGRLGRRDRLPYSDDFATLRDAFNRRRAAAGDSPLAPHQLWRLVASLAK